MLVEHWSQTRCLQSVFAMGISWKDDEHTIATRERALLCVSRAIHELISSGRCKCTQIHKFLQCKKKLIDHTRLRFKNNKPHPWSKDVSSFIVYPEAANQTIYSPRLEENDIGNYSCILRNETHAIKHEIELRLQDKLDNPMPTFRPKDLMVSVGESARFYCEAFVGNLYLPDATNEIVWSQMFDDHPHNVSDSMQVNVTREEGQIIGSYLSIPNIQAHHYGRYRCQIVSGNSAQKLNLSVLLSPVQVTAITDTQLSVLVYVMATLLLVLVVLFAWICRTVQQRTSSKKDNRCSAQFIANNEHENV
ncbi:AGAP001350-PA [Anopheles gambiae str. PEST]|uniref:Soluble interferon alpha/beta receptor OPG204 n=1 Tax=Anopheles gambiae TaxID=7165 RepID=A7UVN9_ANOGA|nr:AGAP001350-PA [Anopheles gambiae str. PEST]